MFQLCTHVEPVCYVNNVASTWKIFTWNVSPLLSLKLNLNARYSMYKFANYTALKWRLEKENHDSAPELIAYAVTRSFNIY